MFNTNHNASIFWRINLAEKSCEIASLSPMGKSIVTLGGNTFSSPDFHYEPSRMREPKKGPLVVQNRKSFILYSYNINLLGN